MRKTFWIFLLASVCQGYEIKINTTATLPVAFVHLRDYDSPVAGAESVDVIVSFQAPGDAFFTAKDITVAGTWDTSGLGIYKITFSAADIGPTAGRFIYIAQDTINNDSVMTFRGLASVVINLSSDTAPYQAKGFSGSEYAKVADSVLVDSQKYHAKGFTGSEYAEMADSNWNEATRDLTDKTGYELAVAERVAVKDTLLNAANQFKADVTNLDVAVSTRSSHSAANVWSVGTRALTDKSGFALSSVGNEAVADSVRKDSLVNQAKGFLTETDTSACQAKGFLVESDTTKCQAKGFAVSGDPMTLTTGERAAVKDTMLNAVDSFKTDVSSLALQSEVANLNGWNPTTDSVLTENPSAYKANVTNLDIAVSSVADSVDSTLTGAHGSGGWTTGGVADSVYIKGGSARAVAETTDVVLSVSHGSALWISGLTGDEVVTLYVLSDADSSAMSDVMVTVRNMAGTKGGVYITNASGGVSFTCAIDTYLVTKKKFGCAFELYDTLRVTGNLTDTVFGTVFSAPTPPSATTCELYGYLQDVGGDNEAATGIGMLIVQKRQIIGGQLVKAGTTYVDADTTGKFVWTVLRGANVRVIFSNYLYNKRGTVPADSSSLNIENFGE